MKRKQTTVKYSLLGALITTTVILSAPSYGQNITQSHTEFAPWMEKAPTPINNQIESIHYKSTNSATTSAPLSKEKKPLASQTEIFYAERIIDELSQFGYEIFQNPNEQDNQQALTGGMSRDSVIIGIGDSLEIILRGQINEQQEYTISPQGLLILDQFPPISSH